MVFVKILCLLILAIGTVITFDARRFVRKYFILVDRNRATNVITAIGFMLIIFSLTLLKVFNIVLI